MIRMHKGNLIALKSKHTYNRNIDKIKYMSPENISLSQEKSPQMRQKTHSIDIQMESDRDIVMSMIERIHPSKSSNQTPNQTPKRKGKKNRRNKKLSEKNSLSSSPVEDSKINLCIGNNLNVCESEGSSLRTSNVSEEIFIDNSNNNVEDEKLKETNRKKNYDTQNKNYVVEKTSKINCVKNVNWERIKPQRGGIIPYTIYEDEVYFGLGVDTQTGDMTDFGGGIRYKKDGDAVTGSLREFMEESLCVFGSYESDSVSNNIVVYNDTIMIVFIHFELNMEKINRIFDSRVKNSNFAEISSLIWLPKSIFISTITTGVLTTEFFSRKLYFRVRKLLQSCVDFCSCL